MKLELCKPDEIEKRSFALIERELPHPLDAVLAPIIMRVIHTTADFDFADTLINKAALTTLGAEALCFMADEDVALAAKQQGITRATASMDKAATLPGRPVFAIGNAPTALVRLYELIHEGKLSPSLIIGVPVGFVNVVQAKELIMGLVVPYIVARGRKGGSGVAAAIVNALLYEAKKE